MYDSDSKNKSPLIISGRSWFLQILIISAFLPILNLVSALWTHSKISIETFYLFLGTFLFFIILGTRIIKVTKKDIIYYSYIVLRKSIPLKNIEYINVVIDKRYGGNSGPAFIPMMYIIGFDSKKIESLVLSTFDKKDLTQFINTIRLSNSEIKFNNDTEIAIGDFFDSLENENVRKYYNSLRPIFYLMLLAFLIFGFRFLFQ